MQQLKKHRRIFESCEKWWNNLKSSLIGSMNPIQITKSRRPINIFTPESVKATLATYNEPEDFMLP
jgi:hypothetical protein